MKLIVGLGNPGKEYENTRHNVGFIIIDKYVNDSNWQEKEDYLYMKKKVKNEDIIFLKPLTYMNLSGIAVRKIVNFYKIDPKDILVIHDDLDLPISKYRIKFASSSGGHNGIKNIIDNLGTNSFARLKIGIGSSKKIDTKNYVLGKLSEEEKNLLNNEVYINIINDFVDNDIQKIMNKYNSKG